MTTKPDAEARELLRAASRARRKAYAPYSAFRVGAAVRGGDGRVYSGCNVENVSYGLTVCAERVAVFQAVAAGVRRLRAAAVVADGPLPPYPCGACRQVLAEFLQDNGIVWVATAGRLRTARGFALASLLPCRFKR